MGSAPGEEASDQPDVVDEVDAGVVVERYLPSELLNFFAEVPLIHSEPLCTNDTGSCMKI